MPAKTNLTKDQEQHIADLYVGGMSSIELGNQYGLSSATIFRILRDCKVKPRSISESAAVRAAKQAETSRYNGRYCVFHSVKNNCWIPAASTYEYIRMHQLENDPDVVSFHRCKRVVPYLLSGKRHHYLPDIEMLMTSGKVQIEEIKPAAMKRRRCVVIKSMTAGAHFAGQGIVFRLITENEIGRETIAKFDWAGVVGMCLDEVSEIQKKLERKRQSDWAREKRRRCPPSDAYRAEHNRKQKERYYKFKASATPEQIAERKEKARLSTQKYRERKRALE